MTRLQSVVELPEFRKRAKAVMSELERESAINVNAGLKLLHSPKRKYLSLTGIGLSIDPHSGCGQTGGRCLGFRLCLTVGCV